MKRELARKTRIGIIAEELKRWKRKEGRKIRDLGKQFNIPTNYAGI